MARSRQPPPRRAFGTLRKLPSGRWQASYVGPDGHRHRGWSTFLEHGDAVGWLRDEEVLIDRGEWTPPVLRAPVPEVALVTLAQYAEANLRRRATRARRPLRASTIDLYRRLLRLVILPQLGGVPLAGITPEAIHRWHDALPPDRPTQNGNAYALLRSLLQDAVDEDLIPRNPARIKGAGKPEPKRDAEALTVGELVVYFAHVPDRYRLPLMLATWCALRSGEVRGLRRCDIADDGKRLRVSQTVQRVGVVQREWHYGKPKTKAGERTVAVPPHLHQLVVDALQEWDADPGNTDPTGLLFPALDGRKPLNDSVLREAHKTAAKAIGRPTLTVHDLRRTGATLAAQSGATVREVMRMLGHTQPGVAMLYQVADETRDTERAARMSELTRGEHPAVEQE